MRVEWTKKNGLGAAGVPELSDPVYSDKRVKGAAPFFTPIPNLQSPAPAAFVIWPAAARDCAFGFTQEPRRVRKPASQFLAGRAVNKDRRRGRPHELIGDTPQQQPLEAAATVRGQGDEVARLHRGLLQYGLDRVLGEDDPCPDWHALLSDLRSDVFQVRLRPRLLRRLARRTGGSGGPSLDAHQD